MLQLLSLANNNRVIWGLTMLLMNLGARYIAADLGKSHEKIFSSQFVKKLIIFSLFFVATRDILLSFLLSILYVIIIDGILHENSKFCIVPKSVIDETATKNDFTLKNYQQNIMKLIKLSTNTNGNL